MMKNADTDAKKMASLQTEQRGGADDDVSDDVLDDGKTTFRAAFLPTSNVMTCFTIGRSSWPYKAILLRGKKVKIK